MSQKQQPSAITDLRSALESLGEGKIPVARLCARLSDLLADQPQWAEPILQQLERAYTDRLLSTGLYRSVKLHVDNCRTGQRQQAETKAVAEPRATVVAGEEASARVPAAQREEGGEDMASEIRAAISLPEQAGSVAGSSAVSEFLKSSGATGAGMDAEAGGGAASLSVGSVIRNRFQLLEVIGEGGMGKVFKGIDLLKQEARDKNPYVAIKLLNEDFKRHPEAFIALQRESSRQQQLAHPNIATVYDFDRIGDGNSQAYITMEFMDGLPLDSYLRRTVKPDGGLPFEQAFPIIQGLGRALEYAHKKNIVHSDFKPGNSFLCKDGAVKVLDFGIARAVTNPLAGDGPKTFFDVGKLGALTPAYASLEMLEGEAAPDPRDDIYALGCVAYQLLAGEHPFGNTPANVARDNRLAVAPVKGLKRDQMRALAHALAFERKNRAANISAWLEALEGKARHQNAWKLPALAAAVAAAVLLASYGTARYLHQREIDEIIGDINQGDSQRIEQTLALLDKYEIGDRRHILDRVRERLERYFERRVVAVADPALLRYDFPLAEKILGEAARLYPDSRWLTEFSGTVAMRKELLLERLGKEYAEHLEAGHLLADNQGEDITDVLKHLAVADPVHPLLKDPRLFAAYLHLAEDLFGKDSQERLDQVIAHIDTLLEQGADLEARDAEGVTALHRAALGDSPELARLLLDRGANLEARDEDGGTPLHYAARFGGSPEVVHLLLDRGAALEARDTRGATPLHYAVAAKDSSEVVRLLLDRGADVEAQDAEGVTPLDRAALDASPEIARLLQAQGTDAKAKARPEAVSAVPAEDGRVARVEGLKQDLLLQLKARDVESAKVTLQSLQPELLPEDPFLAQAFLSFEDSYLRLATDEARKGDREAALALIREGRELVPGALRLEEAEERFGREGRDDGEGERGATLSPQTEALQQELLAQLAARDVAAAKATLRLLQPELPADAPFLATQGFPAFEDSYLQLAADEAGKGDYDASLALIREGRELVPGSSRLEEASREYSLLESQMRRQEVQALMEKGRSLYARKPPKEELVSRVTQVLLEPLSALRRRPEEAIAVYDEVVRRFGNDTAPDIRASAAEALCNKGEVLYDRNRTEEAIAAYNEVESRFGGETAPDIRAQVARALFGRGTVLAKKGRRIGAIAVYDEMVRRFGDDPAPDIRASVAEALFNKGEVLYVRNRTEEAIAAYSEVESRFGGETAPAIRVQVVRALFGRGTALAKKGRREEAISVYDEIVRRFGDDTVPAVRNQVDETVIRLRALKR